MRNVHKGCMALTAMLVFSPYGWSQTRQSGQAARADTGKTMVDQLSKNGGGGPAPRRDLNGFWAGPSSARINEVPPMTPWGQEQFRTHKNHAQFSEAESNDPLKFCDPLGFPRNMLNLIRGVGFFQMSDRMILLSQYNRVWREIFTDGRELPKDVGGTADDSPYRDGTDIQWGTGRAITPSSWIRPGPTKEPGWTNWDIPAARNSRYRNDSPEWTTTHWK